MILNWLLVSLVLSLLMIIMDIIALSLLFKVNLVNFSSSQKYLLAALCLTELCFGISLVLDFMGQIFGFVDKFPKYLLTFQLACSDFMYWSIMIILTLDWSLEFCFNIKYFLIWSSKKTLIILGLLSCIALVIYIYLLPFSDKVYSHRKYLILYIFVPITCIYCILASLTYCQIFKKIKEIRKQSQELKDYISKGQLSENRKQKRIQVFLPSFIILTFILRFPFAIVVFVWFSFSSCTI